MAILNVCMSLKFNSKIKLPFFARKSLVFTIVSLLFVTLLFFSPLFSVFSDVSFFATAAEVQVATEQDLRDVVSGAMEPTIITITNDITLTGTALTIPAGVDITLKSVSDFVFCKLTGASGQDVLVVEGMLTLDGVILTHLDGNSGRGVNVTSSGTFVMINGEISGNSVLAQGGGVSMDTGAIFTMFGGVISNNTVSALVGGGGGVYNLGGVFTVSGDNCVIVNNTAGSGGGGGVLNQAGVFTVSGKDCMIANNTSTYGYGGGVFNDYSRDGGFNVGSVFIMYGGEISNNTANSGGGVFNNPRNTFVMFDGLIANNTAWSGGGVNNWGNFTLVDGLIVDNTARVDGGDGGGGVYHHVAANEGDIGVFTMLGGTIANNTASSGGGVYFYGVSAASGNFTMLSGTIVNNTATSFGGGVYNNYGNFTMSGDAEIFGNTASSSGGGVYNSRGNFTMLSGTITNNTAASNGGGIYNYGGHASYSYDFILSTGIVANNKARNGGGVYNSFYNFTMYDGVISNNTASGSGGSSGGGVYNLGSLQHTANFTLLGNGEISDNAAVYGGGVFNYLGNFAMFGNGEISGNMADYGGGVYLQDSGFVDLFAGKVFGNTASFDGGGVWVTADNDVVDFERLFIGKDVVFSNNCASVAYSRDSSHDTVYGTQIEGSVWTAPFVQGYNNYDISYTGGMQYAFFDVTVYDSYALQTGAGSYLAGEFVTISAGSRSGYVFSSWTVSEGGISISNVDTVTFVMPESNVVVTANWVKNDGDGGGVDELCFSVVYVGNGNTGGVVPVDHFSPYASGKQVMVLGPGNLVREGYSFLGWSQSSFATVAAFTAGSIFTIQNDVELFAVWGHVSYTITYQPGTHGTFNEQITGGLHYGDQTPVAPTVTGETGWSFTGWSPTPSTTVTGDATYVAQWTQTTTAPSPSATASPSPSPSPSFSPSPPSPTLSASPIPTLPEGTHVVDGVSKWAIVNLILSIVGVVLAVLVSIRALLLKKTSEDDKVEQKSANSKMVSNSMGSSGSQGSNSSGDDEMGVQHRILWLVVGVVLAVVGVVVFLITEDTHLSMGWVDKWTIVNAVILVIELVAILFVFKHSKVESKQK
jgi:uncharacterized repeat protein (TIGR02543 family)